jgi:hypothetical protein
MPIKNTPKVNLSRPPYKRKREEFVPGVISPSDSYRMDSGTFKMDSGAIRMDNES